MNHCECGCGTPIPAISKLRRPQRFVHGHNGRSPAGPPGCAVLTCPRRAHAGGYCGRHAARLASYGTIHPITARIDPVRYFWSLVLVPAVDDGCWLWGGALNKAGYGELAAGYAITDGRTRMAHRVSYELRLAPVPDDLHLDHLCRVPRCVNPDHLEPVTTAENTRRGLHGVLRTHCQRGHELTESGTYVRRRDNSRKCRTCNRDDRRTERAALRAEIALGNAGMEP